MTSHEEAVQYQGVAKQRMGENYKIIAGDMERVRTNGTLDHALRVGQTAPDFTLPNAFGEQIVLKSLLDKGPVVLSFYRGEWCPFCNIELRGLQQQLARMQHLDASLVAISPEKPDFGIVAAQKNELTYPVLSDFGNKVARQFGIVFEVGEELKEFSKNVFKNDLALRNADGSYELPVPATFILDAHGVVRFAHVDVDYMVGRAEPEAVVAALEQIVAQPVAAN